MNAMKANQRARRAARHLFRLCLGGGVMEGVMEEDRVRHIARRIGASRRRGAVAVANPGEETKPLDTVEAIRDRLALAAARE